MPTESDQIEPKRELRVIASARRRALPALQLDAAREANTSHLIAACTGLRRVAAFVPFGTEAISLGTLQRLADLVDQLLVPVVLNDRDLDWTQWEDDTLLGVDAISACDLIVVPALLVDRRGFRLGRGGGSYDRALGRVASTVQTVAVLHDGEIVESVPTDAWDVPVRAAITPSGGWVELMR
jgi:5-formyltetrahydrofolate cyclo-ligase